MKTLTSLLLILGLLFGLSPAMAQEPLRLLDKAEASDRFFKNPSNLFDIGDPHILPVGGKYYAFATGGSIGYNVWESDNFKSWGNKKKALRKVEWGMGDYWAPEVYPYMGQYVMLFSVKDKQSKSLRLGIAFSDEVQGPYEDPLGKPLFESDTAVIDASLYVEDGIPYLYYVLDCSENIVNGRHESHIYGVQLSEDLMSFVGEPVLLAQPDQAWELSSGDWLWNEGPIVIKHDALYYLFYSANFYASPDYSVGAAVGKSPLGPFTKQANNPLLAPVFQDSKTLVSGPGHNSFFTVGEELFTSYHSHKYIQAPSGNRQLNIDRAGFHADGTAFINGPTLARQLRPLKDLGLVNAMKNAAVKTSSGDGSLLSDGDWCTASSDYAWMPESKGIADIQFESPVLSDMLLIYPAYGTGGDITVYVNENRVGNFQFETERLPGDALILYYEKTSMTSLRLELQEGLGLGEVIITAYP